MDPFFQQVLWDPVHLLDVDVGIAPDAEEQGGTGQVRRFGQVEAAYAITWRQLCQVIGGLVIKLLECEKRLPARFPNVEVFA